MARTAPNTPAEAKPRPIPGRIGAVLHVLATIITHARHFAATATTRASTPEFAPAAAVFGTDHSPTILHRIQRGLLRALALQEYLLARAARGRTLRFAWPPCVERQPHHRPPAKPAPAPRPAPLRPRQPDPALLDQPTSHLPTPEELAAEVRRRPVGRTIAYICMDLGIVPGLCQGEFWNQVEKTLRRYGGSLNRLYQVRARREDIFQRERDRRKDAWPIDWRDLNPSAVRSALGCLIGEPPSGGAVQAGRMADWFARGGANFGQDAAARDIIGPPVLVPS